MPTSARGTQHFWFPAKANGWGWGAPVAWQGWLVLGLALAAIIATFFLFPPTHTPVRFAACHLLISLAVVAVCLLKGEVR